MNYKKKHMRFLGASRIAVAARNRSALVSAKAVQIPVPSPCWLGLVSSSPKGKNLWLSCENESAAKQTFEVASKSLDHPTLFLSKGSDALVKREEPYFQIIQKC